MVGNTENIVEILWEKYSDMVFFVQQSAVKWFRVALSNLAYFNMQYLAQYMRLQSTYRIAEIS